MRDWHGSLGSRCLLRRKPVHPICWEPSFTKFHSAAKPRSTNIPEKRTLRELTRLSWCDSIERASGLDLWLAPLSSIPVAPAAAQKPAAAQTPAADNPRSQVTVTPRTLELHRRSYVFDGHNDLPWAGSDAGLAPRSMRWISVAINRNCTRTSSGCVPEGLGHSFGRSMFHRGRQRREPPSK